MAGRARGALQDPGTAPQGAQPIPHITFPHHQEVDNYNKNQDSYRVHENTDDDDDKQRGPLSWTNLLYSG